MTFPRLLVWISLFGAVACDTEDPTMVVVDNDYAALPDGGDPTTEMTVYRVWWVTSLLSDAVAPGAEGQPQRTVPNADFAYAVLAPGWDPSAPAPPTRFIAARSAAKLSAARGETLHVHVSDDTFVGTCEPGKALSQSDADFITQRIFPAEFAGLAYDATTCTATPLPPALDAGANDAGGSDQAPAANAGTDGAAD
jgi:hypothetical protein